MHMKIWHFLAFPVAIIAILALLSACGGDDDDDGGADSSAATSPESTASGAAASGSGQGTATPGSEEDTATPGSASLASVGADGSMEACDLMTAADVAEVLESSASKFENVSLGRQSPVGPFSSANQCQWTDFSSTDTAWLMASFAPAGSEDDVLQYLEDDQCAGEEMVSGVGDAACYPQYTAQLRTVKGTTYLMFFAVSDSGLNIEDAERTLAERALSRIP